MRIIAITNQKGGAGKTTTTVNLGAALAVAGQKVLIVDLDPQANASIHLGINNPQKSISDFLLNSDTNNLLCNYKFDTQTNGQLDMIPSELTLASTETRLLEEMGRESILKTQLQTIAKEYDFVLIDCPPSLGIFTLNALTVASEVIIPIEAEYFALVAIQSILDTITSVRTKLNPGLKDVYALITKYDVRNNVCHEILKTVKDKFKKNAFATIIRKNVALVEAGIKGKPIVEYDPTSHGSQDYQNLAKEVLEI